MHCFAVFVSEAFEAVPEHCVWIGGTYGHENDPPLRQKKKQKGKAILCAHQNSRRECLSSARLALFENWMLRSEHVARSGSLVLKVSLCTKVTVLAS